MIPCSTLPHHHSLLPQFLPQFIRLDLTGKEKVKKKNTTKTYESQCHISVLPDRINRLLVPAEYVLISVSTGAVCPTHTNGILDTPISTLETIIASFFPLWHYRFLSNELHSCLQPLLRNILLWDYVPQKHLCFINFDNWSYFDFNRLPFIFFVRFLIHCSTPILSMLGFLVHNQKFVSVCVHIYHTVVWEAETPGFIFLGQVSLILLISKRFTVTDYPHVSPSHHYL